MAQMRLVTAERAYRQPPSEGRSAQSTYTLELLRQEVVLREVASSQTAVALESARADLAKTRLASPIDGVISELSARRGEFISPSSVESGMHLMTVSDLSKIAVITEIEEGQVRDIQPNLAANVVILAFPERRFQGRIASISPRGQNRGGKTVFPIRIDLEGDPGDAARVGLTANIEIVAIEKPDALLLEIRAIRWVGSGPQVVVLEKGQPREQKVRFGRSDGARVEILEGLREGDQVVLPEVAPPPTAPPPKK
jgi:RND family efflux transporter MFP subunit